MRQGQGRTPRASFTAGTGNAFADLGLPEATQALAKARLAEAIAETIDRRGLAQGEAAIVLGVDQPTVSKLTNGFSLQAGPRDSWVTSIWPLAAGSQR